MDQETTILVVDDERFHLNVIVDLLGKDYKLTIAKSGERALEIAQEQKPDLILLDVLMPNMDGYQVCQALKSNSSTAKIPVIFLTVKSDVEDEAHGFNCGAVDYITKPFSPPIVRARVKTHLDLNQAHKALAIHNSELEKLVEERTAEIVRTQDVAIYCLTSLVETRDAETGNHIRRTQHYVRTLAEHLKSSPKFSATLTEKAITMMFKSAPLHDIGKVGVPDHILLKPGKLNDEEWQEMKRHAEYGERAIRQAEEYYGCSTFLSYALEIASTHHEKWDGSGYPRGMKGEEIPISGRLMAVSDVYDALISKRVYKPAMAHQEAVRIITEGRGSHFDPEVVDAFLACEEAFIEIANRYAD